MKLEKFNLEKALNGAKVVTRGGLEVTQLTKFQGLGILRTLVGVLGGCMKTWCSNGTFRGGEEHILDLFLAVEPKSIWVNVYKYNDGDLHLGGPHKTKEEAIINHTAGYIKTIEITE